ncbi:ribonuclease J [Candidatus Amarolinea aalborgensis]|uniref:ribonuclease J n=1 Tax=Candidatus Amarolinea aalborgensis TaxID=2249329 RepID=UPI003BF9ACEF
MESEILRVIPLGGVGEIGKNMLALEYNQDILVIDAGLMFPESDMLGVDVVIPDIEYLVERKDWVRAIILTHGHEDHIGALPYILPDLPVPVYATRLTRGLVEVKLKEARITGTEMHTIDTKDVLELGPFKVEFFHVCHSIPDAVGLAITTPVGLVVHVTDYKFDAHPVDGKLTDFAKLSELGDRGVLLLLSDSTNAERPGFTPSEREVGVAFDRLFGQATGRVIVATFASNISRVQQVITTARRYNRRVGTVGRSMVSNVKMASQLGYLDATAEDLLNTDQINNLPANQVAVVCTGSQGEPTSALVRMAMEEHRHLKIRPGDMVIISATPIPGNEVLVNRTINNLFRLGADVHYSDLGDVHVSGHGSQEDYKLLFSLTRPRFFVPIHGEYRHLVLHARLALEMGMTAEQVQVIESGQVLLVEAEQITVGERVTEGHVLVDGMTVGEISEVVLRDRHHLSQDGFVVAIVAVDSKGEVVAAPEILTRGFVSVNDREDLLNQARDRVWTAVAHSAPHGTITNRIKEVLADFLYQQTRRRPMILPLVVEV